MEITSKPYLSLLMIFRYLAGYSLGRADIVRRAMSKKKHDVMQKEKEIFVNGLVDDKGNVIVEGCLRRGVDKNTALSIFAEMESFASYAFNKSHAAAYATVSYQTAFLKCHYPREYMAALLSSVVGSMGKTAVYSSECKRMGIMILPPDVNKSKSKFSVENNNIRYGLSGIKNVGYNLINSIVRNRAVDGEYKSYYDFGRRLNGQGLNAKSLESLIKCGALDCFDCNRREMVTSMSLLLSDLEYERKAGSYGQLSLFDTLDEEDTSFTVNHVRDFSLEEKLAFEREILGVFLSGHPLDRVSDCVDLRKIDKLADIINDENAAKYYDKNEVFLLVIINTVKKQTTRKDTLMAFMTVEDKTAVIEVIVFPDVYQKYRDILESGNIAGIQGSVSYKDEEEPKIIAKRIVGEDDLISRSRKFAKKADSYEAKLYLKFNDRKSEKYNRALNILLEYPGKVRTLLYIDEEKRLLMTPEEYSVSVCDDLLIRLYDLLGKENVKIK